MVPNATQAAEFWHTQPEDGNVYYVVRPPWVSIDKLQAFFTLFPEEQHWKTSHAVQVSVSTLVVQQRLFAT
eukprot:1157824-Pelagomonas_calceolata.AAC.8